ncbi:uncharacterized protein K460DRAFT_358702 [Cucurbitaria berberidis CBS 394.84]|uniref:Uncharacterized protein n=1 Tax=Cucurbitaria berberidis CBS 394.84 TaxID=1168544 RepID=A0A9P4GAM2_9PLEO|nr:uncharacterized protein K460DRAFT_358702 [Cucurbitaria berberidis CBS 394.84]KAF1842024.1 hypothetical protein K460DRAFT_358702 [Cucurbitaria berberidis CBS 394.84]
MCREACTGMAPDSHHAYLLALCFHQLQPAQRLLSVDAHLARLKERKESLAKSLRTDKPGSSRKSAMDAGSILPPLAVVSRHPGASSSQTPAVRRQPQYQKHAPAASVRISYPRPQPNVVGKSSMASACRCPMTAGGRAHLLRNLR